MKKKILLFTAAALLIFVLASCGKKDDNGGNTDSGNTQTPDTSECKHNPDNAVRENEVEPTCTAEGGYDEVVYCKKCGEELSREKKQIEKLEHTAGEMVEEIKTPPTCKIEGVYYITIYCMNCKEELVRTEMPLDILEHTESDAVKENVIEATCLEDGRYDSVVYCSKCKDELSREKIETKHTGHIAADGVEENRLEPSCETDGKYDTVVYCSVCGDELSRKTEIIPAKGHIEGENTCPTCGKTLVVEQSLDFALSNDGTYYIVTGIGSCTDVDLVIPSTYKGLPVKEIGNNAFRDCAWIKTATIPASVERLGYGAAYGCTSLEKLIFEDTTGWYLMDTPDATNGTSIPSFILKNPGIYIDQLIISNVMWMTKNP